MSSEKTWFTLNVGHTINGRTRFTRVGAAFLNTTKDGAQVLNIKPDFDIVLKAGQGAVGFEPKERADDVIEDERASA